MTTILKTKRLILGIILILCFFPAISQVKPEVTLGLRYSSEKLFLVTYDNHPLAFEAGGGINFNEKWYTGVNANFFRTKSVTTDAKYILSELELRRSFGFTSLPKMSLFLSFRPGFIFVNAYLSQTESHFNRRTMAISFSPGASYSITDHIKFSIWPGLTWLPQENPGSSKLRTGFFGGTGVTYKF